MYRGKSVERTSAQQSSDRRRGCCLQHLFYTPKTNQCPFYDLRNLGRRSGRDPGCDAERLELKRWDKPSKVAIAAAATSAHTTFPMVVLYVLTYSELDAIPASLEEDYVMHR